jgi:hypothetical protein
MDSIQTFICNSSNWYTLVLSSSLIYFVIAVLSTLFTKESGFLKFSSVFYDNVVISFALTAVFQRFLSTKTFIALECHVFTSNGWSVLSTCELTAYIHFYLQLNGLFSLCGLLYTVQTFSRGRKLHDKVEETNEAEAGNSQCIMGNICAQTIKITLSLRCLSGSRRHGNSSRFILGHAKRFIILQWCLGLAITLALVFSGLLSFPKTIFICCFVPLHINIIVKVIFAVVFVSNLFAIVLIFRLTKNRLLRMLVSVNHKKMIGDVASGFTI